MSDFLINAAEELQNKGYGWVSKADLSQIMLYALTKVYTDMSGSIPKEQINWSESDSGRNERCTELFEAMHKSTKKYSS